jgi:hypothetical protein
MQVEASGRRSSTSMSRTRRDVYVLAGSVERAGNAADSRVPRDVRPRVRRRRIERRQRDRIAAVQQSFASNPMPGSTIAMAGG